MIRPIRLPVDSANHRLPSEPAVMRRRTAPGVMPALNSVMTCARAAIATRRTAAPDPSGRRSDRNASVVIRRALPAVTDSTSMCPHYRPAGRYTIFLGRLESRHVIPDGEDVPEKTKAQERVLGSK